ncbi:Hypothetical protein MAU_6220 [Metamycoplasma auris 15026]|uniref:Uncharacterized protein n=1 Tax=Metamycoplasma auris 15026 TaxID=1188233 RepID=N9UZC7_9BACT|nr:hypothetical protein [Metamycoplasma auris]ENY68542.1 Hypothetical protein MAU_6220 [Metamycoplasma auris 15026]
MTSERKISIVSIIIKLIAIALIAAGIYLFVKATAKDIKVITDNFEKEGFKETIGRIVELLKNLIDKKMIFIILGVGIFLAILTYILDLIILSIASWKSQAFGKVILFITTLLPILWIISGFGNIAIAVKKRIYPENA